MTERWRTLKWAKNTFSLVSWHIFWVKISPFNIKTLGLKSLSSCNISQNWTESGEVLCSQLSDQPYLCPVLRCSRFPSLVFKCDLSQSHVTERLQKGANGFWGRVWAQLILFWHRCPLCCFSVWFWLKCHVGRFSEWTLVCKVKVVYGTPYFISELHPSLHFIVLESFLVYDGHMALTFQVFLQ